MSKILASIADAERLAGYDPDCSLIDETCARATAARAEHAEIVDVLVEARDLILYDHPGDGMGLRIDTLLSRIAPERAS